MEAEEHPLFFVDTRNRPVVSECESGNAPIDTETAWNDDEDEKVEVRLDIHACKKRLCESKKDSVISGTEYRRRLRAKIELQGPRPSWAGDIPLGEQEPIIYDPFAIVRPNQGKDRGILLPDFIAIRRYRSLKLSRLSNNSIACIDFHPGLPWVLGATKSGEIGIFQVDRLEDRSLFSLKIHDWNVTAAKFTVDGQKVLFCGTGSSLIIWRIQEKRIERILNIPGRREKQWSGIEMSKCGRFIALLGSSGYVVLLSVSSLRPVGTLKMNGEAFCCSFDSTGSTIFTAGSEKKIYIWETKSFRCIRTVNDDSGASITSLAVSPDDAQLIVGSELGVLNFYSIPALMSSDCTMARPSRALLNLTTRITRISVHPSSELLAYSSADRNRAFRFVHLQTGQVFSNWPKSNSPISKVQCIAFAPSGHYMAIGNNKGAVLLYGLRHYE